MPNALSLFMPINPGTSPLKVGLALAGMHSDIVTALNSIGTVHFARFLLLDRSQPNLIPPLPLSAAGSDTLVVSVITEYDGDFDVYIQDFVAQLSKVFNQLLSITVGGNAIIPVENNVAAFEAFITANDASKTGPSSDLGQYAAYPQTVQQILAAFPTATT